MAWEVDKDERPQHEIERLISGIRLDILFTMYNASWGGAMLGQLRARSTWIVAFFCSVSIRGRGLVQKIVVKIEFINLALSVLPTSH